MRKIFVVITAILMFFCSLLGCGGTPADNNNGNGNGNNAVIEKTQVLLLKPYSVSIKSGEEFLLEYRMKNVVGKVEFSSSDTTVATVNSVGIVKAIAPGECKITVKIADLSENCAVTVTPAPTYNVFINKSEIIMVYNHNEEYVISPELKKGYDTIKDATFSYYSENEAVATVTPYGAVKAKGIGETEISVVCEYGGNKYINTVKVVVTDGKYIDVEREISADLRESEKKIDYSIRNFDGSKIPNATAVITVEDESVCKLIFGSTVKLIQPGVTYINFEYGNGVKSRVKINVVFDVNYVEHNEYNSMLHEDYVKDVTVFRLADVNYNSTGQATLVTKNIGEKHHGEGKLSVVNRTYNGNQIPFYSIRIPCRKTLEEIIALKEEGYTKICVDIYVDLPASSKGGWIHCFNKLYSREPSCVTIPVFREWFTYEISIDELIKNYDAVQSGEKGLISVQPDETEKNPWQIYLSAISFEK